MRKKKKLLQRIIALVLVAALWWQTDSMRFFVTAFAAEMQESSETNAESTQVNSDSEDEEVPVTVLGEVETLRTEGEKHFRMSDGSFMAVSYGMPVHYQDEDGEWQDIDNRMVLSKDQTTYQTYNLQSTTNFASSLTDGLLFETSYEDTSVTMSLLDTMSADSLMKEETEFETEIGLEAEIETVIELETETELETEAEIEAKIETETVNPDLLVFDRTAVADTTVEVQDVLGSISDVSQADNKDKGWTMEDILPENIQDSLLYEDVFPGVDLLYTKYSHNVKEQIIVNSVQETYRYDFMLTLDGVEAVLNEDGSVSLVAEENLENEIYYIPAPFMEDADGVVSYDVEYMLTEVSDGVILTVVADTEWMNAKERAFPVAIDPSIIVKRGEGDEEIYASYTSKGMPDQKFEGDAFYAGYTTYNSKGEYCGFINFNSLPDIPAGMTVVEGHLELFLKGYTHVACEELGLGIYEVTSAKPAGISYSEWINNLTWNTKPNYDTENMIDYTNVSVTTTNQPHSWDITELVKKWYIEDTQNRTVAMTMVPGEYSDTHCAEARFTLGKNVHPPVITISYRSYVGIEPYYTYQTMGVGDAGTLYLADATGQFKVVNPIISYASTINPFSLSLVYNSDYFADDADRDYQPPEKMGQENVGEGITSGNISMKLGQGWTLDIIQTMHTETIGETEYICYTDGDGTKHYFVKDDGKNSADDSDKTFYYDEDGLGLKAEITNTEKTSFIMYDDSGNSWTFTNGRLVKISDETVNAYWISWNSNNQITKISQLNRGNAMSISVAEFTYSNDGYVSSITDAANNAYSFTYTNGKLTVISKNGEAIAEYSYGSVNYPSSFIDVKSGYKRLFEFRHGKVIGGLEYVNGVHGAGFTVRYPDYSKTVYTTTSEEGTLHTSYLFDYWGRTINAYVTDDANNILGASNAVYVDTRAETTDESVSKQTNRTERIGSLGVSNPTLLHNGGCDNAGWTFSLGTASYDASEHRTGSHSLKITPTITGGAVYASANSLSLTAEETYTLSAYVRTTECTGFSGEGVALKVGDAAGNTYSGKGITYATSSGIDDGWTRIQLTFTPVATGTHVLAIYAQGVTGTFYVDDVQLEKGSTAGTYNLLMNGSMESDVLGWSEKNASISTLSDWSGINAVELTGKAQEDSYFSQTVSINLPATETFVLSGWAKGNSVPDNVTTHDDPNQDTEKQFGLRAKITYTDVNTPEYHYVPFNSDVNEWQFTSLTIVPKCPDETISTIEVICTYGGNANKAYFDNICLSREVAQTMVYDGNGNLESVSTTGLNKDMNSYEGSNLMKVATGGNGTYTYAYDSTYKHRLTGVTDGVISQSLSYDRFGNTIGTALYSNNSSNPLTITSAAAYSTDGNRITGIMDSAGNQIAYEYGSALSSMYALPTTTTDGRGNSTTTAYDSDGRTTEVEVPELVSVSYAYEQGRLASIEREDITGGSTQEYHFEYDIFGRTTEVYVGERLLASYAYRTTGEMTSMTYANGTTVEYEYDILGRVIKEIFKESDVEERIVEYTYDNNGQINSIKDSVSGTENYVYDSLGRVIYYENEETGARCSYTYDMNNRLTYTAYDLEDLLGVSERYSYNSDETDAISDGMLTSMQLVTAHGLGREYDYLQRLLKRSLPSLTENYTYAAGEGENTTTTLVSGKTNTLNGTVISNFEYLYDENGNITRILDRAAGTGVIYTYDELNQLIGASNSSLRMESYTYDAHGNLLTFNNGITTHTYSYADSEWKDQLTAVDGVPFLYDALGNPLYYYNGSNYSLGWTEGRKLATITVGGKTTDYLYDAGGNRIKKINDDDSYIIYVNVNGVPLGEKHYSAQDELVKTLRYIYDENGSVCGYIANSADGGGTYHFIKNLQGDVTHVYRLGDNAIVASYSYDSWGNIISAAGEKAEENPFRYRGYYYDVESGFYATGSRYYDSEIGRFINADDVSYLGADGTPLSYNLYAYCYNNPINMTDDFGNLPSWATKVIIGTAVIAAAAILTVATAGTGTALACFAVGALKGAAIGAAVGAVSGAATGAVTHRVTTGSWEGVGNAALEGAADGYMSGAITGFISGGLTSNVCFVAGTTVLTSCGTVVIENIEVGDYVWASDPETGEVALKQVVHTFVNEANELVHVVVNGEEIVCTNEHPFYSPVKGWIAACDLRAGDILVTVKGEYVVVEKTQHEILESPVKVYNFEVEDFHTYYVTDTGILVHNTCRAARKANLPTEGKIRYVPPKGTGKNLPRTSSGGYIDKFDNIWIKGPSRTIGEAFEWDVQLSKAGQKMLGWLSRDNAHINVSLRGIITHR